MKPFVFMLILTIVNTAVWAQDSTKIKALELKIHQLESRLERLERINASPRIADVVRKRELAARARAARDSVMYKVADIDRAEALYGRASRLMRSNDAAAGQLLDSIVAVYPGLNRAGCAQLYRAQQENGPEQERLLKDCIDRFGDCYYFDGAQVGPLAMFKLAYYYLKAGQQQKAHELFKRIQMESPEAIDHSSQLLTEQIHL